MTEAETWHMMLLATENLAANFESFLTIVFGYLATAYFVGKKLTRFQAALVSVFFIFATGLTGFFALVMWRRATFFVDQLVSSFGVQSFAPNHLLVLFGAVGMALFIPACVVFMYQSRRRATLEVAGE